MTTPNLKYLLTCLALGLAVAACRQSSNPEVAPEQPGGPATKAPTSKVILTYTGEIKDGDWIEIDDLGQIWHRVDTLNPVRILGEPARFEPRTMYPSFVPTLDVENLWTSQGYTLGALTGRWWQSEKSAGFAPTSLFYHLMLYKQKAGAYQDHGKPYNVKFEGIGESEFQRLNSGATILLERAYNRFTRLRLERTDGQPIRIRTSEGYAAKTEYQ